MQRQGEALARVECHETGNELSRQSAIADADRDRAAWGLPPLKTEVEFHRKAVERGLICR
jgi:hypothetical protein